MQVEAWQMILGALGLFGGPAGAAWVGVKVAVNGMREDIREIKVDVKDLRNGHSDNRERIVALETRGEE